MRLNYLIVLLTNLIALVQGAWDGDVKPNIIIILADDMVSRYVIPALLNLASISIFLSTFLDNLLFL